MGETTTTFPEVWLVLMLCSIRFAALDIADPVTGRMKAPVIPGHEFCGIVEALGEGSAEEYGLKVGSKCTLDPLPILAERLLTAKSPFRFQKVGDLVVCEQIFACHNCWFCKKELYNKCDKLRIYGQAVDGACADYMLYRKGSFIYKCPEGMTSYQAVLVEPVAVSVHAMERAKLEDGMTVLIAGAGPIGLGVVAAIRHYFPSIKIVRFFCNRVFQRSFRTDGTDRLPDHRFASTFTSSNSISRRKSELTTHLTSRHRAFLKFSPRLRPRLSLTDAAGRMFTLSARATRRRFLRVSPSSASVEPSATLEFARMEIALPTGTQFRGLLTGFS